MNFDALRKTHVIGLPWKIGLRISETFLPMEVTAAYMAIQGIFYSNKIGPSESVWFMLMMIGLLAAINIAIYWIFYKTTNVLVHAVLLPSSAEQDAPRERWSVVEAESDLDFNHIL
jgi:hypothetical protein